MLKMFTRCKYFYIYLHQVRLYILLKCVGWLIGKSVYKIELTCSGTLPGSVFGLEEKEQREKLFSFKPGQQCHMIQWSDVSVKLSVSLSPLHLAARSGLKKAVQDLLSRGANVQTADENGRMTSITPSLLLCMNASLSCSMNFTVLLKGLETTFSLLCRCSIFNSSSHWVDAYIDITGIHCSSTTFY